MKYKFLERLLRALVVLLGAGIGAALTALVFHLIALYGREEPQPLMIVALAYSGAVLAGGLVFFVLSRRILALFSAIGNAVEKRFDEMTVGQMTGCIGGLIAGLLIAALFTRMLMNLGALGVILASILYVGLGAIGWTVGWKRGDELLRRFGGSHFSGKRFRKKKGTVSRRAGAPLADLSALVDGRILAVAETGFIGSELNIPVFVAAQIRRLAESSDPQKAARGRRAEGVMAELEKQLHVRAPEDADPAAGEDAEERLVRLAKKLRAPVITCSGSLAKLAALSEVRVMNINGLAAAMRPAVAAGETLTVAVAKKGKEAGQGVGYLDDGTMIVVEGAGDALGRSVQAVVTSVLQTSAGRMVFAKLQ